MTTRSRFADTLNPDERTQTYVGTPPSGEVFLVSDTSPATYVPFGTGAVATPYLSKSRAYVEPEDYSASTIRDYSVDATDAIQKAAVYAGANGDMVRCRSGSYKTGGTVYLGMNGVSLEGAGGLGTRLTSPTSANPLVSIGVGPSQVKVRRLELTRAVQGTLGGDGLVTTVAGYMDCLLEEIWSRNNYRNFVLGCTAFSRGRNLRATNGTSHGFHLINGPGGYTAGSQWYLDTIYSHNNGQDGFRAEADALALPVYPITLLNFPIGELVNFQTSNNSGKGFSAIGRVLCPLQSIRGRNWFVGEDGDDEIFLDTYGTAHQISQFFVELAGASPTGSQGPSYGVALAAASHIGHGINISANNTDVQITNGLIKGCAYSGVINSSPSLKLTDVKAQGNGINGTTLGGKSGFVNLAGNMALLGCQAVGNTDSGIGSFSGTTTMLGGEISGNTLAPVTISGGVVRATAVKGYTDWKSWPVAPAGSASAGVVTIPAGTGNYRIESGEVDVELTLQITNNAPVPATPGSVAILSTLPVPPAVGANVFFIGRENGVSAKTLFGFWNGTALEIKNADGTYPGATGAVMALSGRYKIA